MPIVEPAEPSDSDLITRARRGDRDAFAALYRRHHAAVYRFARSMSGSTVIAEDVTQEVFVMLIRDLSRYEPERAALQTYLYGVARNVTRGRMRSERRFVALEATFDEECEPTIETDIDGALNDAQNIARLRRIIAALPSRYREVIVLCELHGLSYADAAAVVRTRVGTVRSRLHRARNLIAERLKERDTTVARAISRKAGCLA